MNEERNAWLIKWKKKQMIEWMIKWKNECVNDERIVWLIKCKKKQMIEWIIEWKFFQEMKDFITNND